MELFMKRYNRYVKKNVMKYSDNNQINFRKATNKGGEFKRT